MKEIYDKEHDVIRKFLSMGRRNIEMLEEIALEYKPFLMELLSKLKMDMRKILKQIYFQIRLMRTKTHIILIPKEMIYNLLPETTLS